MKKINALVIVTLLLTLGATAAQASVINVFSGVGTTNAAALEQTWLGIGSGHVTDSFESYATNAVDTGSGFAMSVGTIYGYGHVGDPTSTMTPYGEHATDGIKYWSNAAPNNTNDKGDFWLNLNPGMNTVGFYTTDLHDVGGQTWVTVNTLSGSQNINLFDYTGVQSSGTEIYFIVQANEEISSIVFHKATGANDGYAIDGITTSNTPIPAAAWLLGSGLLGLVGLRRVRS